MARENGNSSVAAVAIVVLVLIALGAGYLLWLQAMEQGIGVTPADAPDVDIEAPQVEEVPEPADPEPVTGS